MSNKVVVRFLKAWRGYSAGELAGFDPEVVEGLQTKGFAEVFGGEGGAVVRPKAPKSPAAKAGGGKSGGKDGAVSALPTDQTAPSSEGAGGGEGDGDDEGGEGIEGEAGADAEGTDDDEAKP